MSLEENMTLEVDVYGKNIEITDRMQKYVDKKVTRLDRYLSDIDEARVDLSFEKSTRSAADRQVAQITLKGKGFLLRSEERADDIFTAIDKSIDKIQRQIERYKGKRNRGRGDGKTAAEVVDEVFKSDNEEAEQPLAIARRKRFIISPMDEFEAIEQMNLLGHEQFFIFYNINNQAINIIYKRRDGSYGVIEPIIG